MRHGLALSLALVLPSLASCNRPYLTWTPREPLAARRGRVALTVTDGRAGDRRVLGRAFGWGGVPREVVVPEGHVEERLLDLLREAAVTAGLGRGQPGEAPTARLSLHVATLGCDGTAATARAQLGVTFVARAPDDSARSEAVLAISGQGRGCEAALARALDQLLDELAARLVEGPMHDLAVGG